MARETLEVRTCDKCGSKEGVNGWTVHGPQGVAYVDLCEKDSEPLRVLYSLGRNRPAPRSNSGTAPKKHHVQAWTPKSEEQS